MSVLGHFLKIINKEVITMYLFEKLNNLIFDVLNTHTFIKSYYFKFLKDTL